MRLLLFLAIASAVATPADEPPEHIAGTWTIAAHECPNICAMDDLEADTYLNLELRFDSGYAGSTRGNCREPKYQSTPVTSGMKPEKGDFLLPPYTIVDVLCDDKYWAGPGLLLFVADGGKIFTQWDGVVFELRRQPNSPLKLTSSLSRSLLAQGLRQPVRSLCTR